jgi:hypothetical protein
MEDLKARYNYLFAGESIGLEFPGGWRGILERLYAAVDGALSTEEKARVSIYQQKEKLGGLRVYLTVLPRAGGRQSRQRKTSPVVAEIRRRLAPLVSAAEEASVKTCIRCGAPGALRYDQPWILPLCDDHREVDDA